LARIKNQINPKINSKRNSNKNNQRLSLFAGDEDGRLGLFMGATFEGVVGDTDCGVCELGLGVGGLGLAGAALAAQDD
jgi:hypothetical protein